ncbi:MAG: Uma2 family endonuclease [Chloroflexi bacterium]|nr:Uma2 family endonuclease [Chloroflexota bacterium]
MTEPTARAGVIWTVDDLELFPDDTVRREIIAGELFVSRAPHPDHQDVVRRLCTALDLWNRTYRLGRLYVGIGIVFSPTDAVIPDLVWASHARWARIVDAEGRLVGAPELVVEVLSPSAEDARRDRELKRKLYAVYGVDEYWIVDRQGQVVELYRRAGDVLERAATLRAGDTLRSPLLPDFALPVAAVFADE